LKILILTQDERSYLPAAFEIVCNSLEDDICSVALLPATSTHGGPLGSLKRLLALFGPADFSRLMLRELSSRFTGLLPILDNRFSSVENVVKRHSIPVIKANGMEDPKLLKLLELHSPDLLISISCPVIIRKNIRERFSKGCINVHSSPLPNYRGLMPAFWILKNGETQTAVTVHDLGAKLDDGEILMQKTVNVSEDETWDSLVRKTKREGAHLLVEAVNRIRDGEIKRLPNEESKGSYFGFPTREDAREFRERGNHFF
jgi:methionyl-tRNA formyltransferase